MNFGEALEALKTGSKVAREGWNGKNMFLYLVRGSEVMSSNLRNEAEDHANRDGLATVKFNDHIDMVTADGSVCVGWLASQTDMLSDDWVIVLDDN